MNFARELVYEEKASRYSFGINDDGMNHWIYDKWLLTRKELEWDDPMFYKKLDKVFNDTYFFCTIVLMNPEGEVLLSYFKKHISLHSLVYPLACFYLENLTNRPLGVERMITQLRDNIFHNHQDYLANYDDLLKLGNEKCNSVIVEASMFQQRKLDEELLSKLDWYGITHYLTDDIKKVISYVARNEDECKMMAEAIERAICLSEEPQFTCDEDGYVSWLPLPDYSEVHQICRDILNGSLSLKLMQSPKRLLESNKNQEREQNSFGIKNSLKNLLRESWFDEYSSDPGKFTREWRDKMVFDLLATDYGEEMLNDWNKYESGKEHNLKSRVKLSLVGALKKSKVLNCRFKDLSYRINMSGLKPQSIADYMGSKGKMPYLEWLKKYITSDVSSPFSE